MWHCAACCLKLNKYILWFYKDCSIASKPKMLTVSSFHNENKVIFKTLN